MWKGRMDWPKQRGWTCEVCGDVHLTWGLVHGICRCDTCHTQYNMRPEGEIVIVPVCRLLPEYYDIVKAGWLKYQKPITQWSDFEWEHTE